MMEKHLFHEIRIPIEQDNPSILRLDEKCIKCGQCRRVCEEEIAVGRLYDLAHTGGNAICIHCGQCANVCPVDSIVERTEYQAVRDAIRNPEKIVIFSTSPSVRVGLGESFQMAPGFFVEGKMVAALRALGADYVLDTNFAADLTILEEASELVERIKEKKRPLPQFTSCCPAWVKFVETFYPQYLTHISSAKSPIGMQGPTIKTFFAKQRNLDPSQIVNVAVTPCTAKKFEIRRSEMNASASELGIENLRDMDYVITTRELAQWIKETDICFDQLEDSPFDDLMGAASGAGVIFGNTGGVMEAAARTAYYLITGENPPEALLNLEPVRGMEGLRAATLEIGGIPLRVAVVHGTANAKEILTQMESEPLPYDFIEVMACRGGCIGGGGQPKTEIPMSDEIRKQRISSLYQKDSEMSLRLSHENPDIKRIYEQFYGKPLSPKAEFLLHTTYQDRSADLGADGMIENPLTYAPKNAPVQSGQKYRCKICGYLHEGAIDSNFHCPICQQGIDQFELLPNEDTVL